MANSSFFWFHLDIISFGKNVWNVLFCSPLYRRQQQFFCFWKKQCLLWKVQKVTREQLKPNFELWCCLFCFSRFPTVIIEIAVLHAALDISDNDDVLNFDCRTFLTTVEIVVICVFTVILVFALIALMIYLYIYGCTKAPWCQRRSKDYSQIQLQRERKIGEIWKNSYVQRV